MVSLRSVYAFVALLQVFTVSPAAAQETSLKGESKGLGLKFEALGQEWCGQRVQIRLDSDDPTVLSGHSEKFQQTLGKIRAIIDSDCPYVRMVSFTGYSGKKLVSYGEMMRAAQWVYRPFPFVGDEPYCQGERNTDYVSAGGTLSSLCAISDFKSASRTS